MATTRATAGYLLTMSGLARAASSDVGPMPLCEAGGVPKPAGSRFETAYAPLVRNIQIGSTSVSPLSGDVRQGSLSYEVVLDDRRYPEVARYLFAQPTVPVAELQAGTSFDAGDTTFTVATSAQATAMGAYIDELVYIRGMALRVEDVNGATRVVTVYDERTDPDGGAYLTLASASVGDIGHAMTYLEDVSARTVGAAPPYPDAEVWGVNPYLRERCVLLYTSDGTNVEAQVGIYLVQSVVLSDSGTFARVSCVDILEVLKGRRFNERAVQLEITAATIPLPTDPPSARVALSMDVLDGDDALSDSIWNGDFAITGDAAPAIIQANKSVYIARGQSYPGTSYSLGSLDDGWVARLVGYDKPAYRSDPPRDGKELVGKKAHELLVSNPDLTATPADHPFYSSDLSAVATHPLDLMQCHAGTIASRLPQHWRCPTPPSWWDTAEIERIRDAVYPDVTAPGVFGGKDGKPVDALAWMWSQYVGLLGGSWAVNASGQITVRCLLDTTTRAGIAVDASLLLPGRGRVTDISRDFDQAIAEVGPGMDGFAGRLRVRGDIDRYRYRYATKAFEFACEAAWLADRVFDPDDPSVATVTGLLRRIAQFMRTLPYEHKLRVTGRYTIETGRQYTFSAPGFRDSSTGLSASAYEFVGYVRERAVDEQTMEQDLVVLEMPAVTWIGMSCAVDSISGGDTLTVDADEFILPLTGGEYEYAPAQTIDTAVEQIGIDIARGLTVECVIVSRRGVAVSQPFTVDSVDSGASTITATSAILATGGGSYTRTAGDRVRLADYTDVTDTQMRDDYGWVSRDVYGL